MTMSVVNCYVCYSSCDVSKAKTGQDPHPATGLAKDVDKDGPSSSLGLADQPAVVFDGALRRTAAADRIAPIDGVAQPAEPTPLSRAGFLVDLLA
jgi:hypothetical protein